MKIIISCILTLVFIAACGGTQYQTHVYHPNIPQSQLNSAFQRDHAVCQLAAQRSVPYPAQRYSPYSSLCNNSSAPDLSCAMRGYYEAQGNPERIRQQNIYNYINACLAAKGYIMTKVPVTK